MIEKREEISTSDIGRTRMSDRLRGIRKRRRAWSGFESKVVASKIRILKTKKESGKRGC